MALKTKTQTTPQASSLILSVIIVSLRIVTRLLFKSTATPSRLQNTKNSVECNYECPLCSDQFSTIEGLNHHKAEHLEENINLDVASLTNEYELFECNLCSFESGHEDSVKEHMIDHVNSPPKKTATTNGLEETVKQSKEDIIHSFESGYGHSVKQHQIQHVMLRKETKKRIKKSRQRQGANYFWKNLTVMAITLVMIMIQRGQQSQTKKMIKSGNILILVQSGLYVPPPIIGRGVARLEISYLMYRNIYIDTVKGHYVLHIEAQMEATI